MYWRSLCSWSVSQSIKSLTAPSIRDALSPTTVSSNSRRILSALTRSKVRLKRMVSSKKRSPRRPISSTMFSISPSRCEKFCSISLRYCCKLSSMALTVRSSSLSRRPRCSTALCASAIRRCITPRGLSSFKRARSPSSSLRKR